jgi:hypothetical protein
VYKPSIIDKLVLLSWLNEGGQTVIYVQNKETNEVQKITSEPNKDNVRIVEVHPNADPKLFEAMISNGNEQGAVKFRLTPLHLSPQIQTTSTPGYTNKEPANAKKRKIKKSLTRKSTPELPAPVRALSRSGGHSLCSAPGCHHIPV